MIEWRICSGGGAWVLSYHQVAITVFFNCFFYPYLPTYQFFHPNNGLSLVVTMPHAIGPTKRDFCRISKWICKIHIWQNAPILNLLIICGMSCHIFFSSSPDLVNGLWQNFLESWNTISSNPFQGLLLLYSAKTFYNRKNRIYIAKRTILSTSVLDI